MDSVLFWDSEPQPFDGFEMDRPDLPLTETRNQRGLLLSHQTSRLLHCNSPPPPPLSSSSSRRISSIPDAAAAAAEPRSPTPRLDLHSLIPFFYGLGYDGLRTASVRRSVAQACSSSFLFSVSSMF
ncbi:hypothetical protein Drorol1_Dr00011575 [Drosera rotundifolia]